VAVVLVLAGAAVGRTQTTEPPPSPAGGKVIFSRGADATTVVQPVSPEMVPVLGKDDPLGVTDAERSALTFTSYDLDAHLTPASSGISVRAAVVVRNDGSVALNRVVLQISSTMRWDAVSSSDRA